MDQRKRTRWQDHQHKMSGGSLGECPREAASQGQRLIRNKRFQHHRREPLLFCQKERTMLSGQSKAEDLEIEVYEKELSARPNQKLKRNQWWPKQFGLEAFFFWKLAHTRLGKIFGL